MKKVGIYLGLNAMIVLLAAPLWAAPSALSDSDMDGVYAKGITIQNNSYDNDMFMASNTQTSYNGFTSEQANRPDNTSRANADAYSGDAMNSTTGGMANANGGTVPDANGGTATSTTTGGATYSGDAYADAYAKLKNPNHNFNMAYSSNHSHLKQKDYTYTEQSIHDVNAADNGSVAIDDIDNSAVANLNSIANRRIEGTNFQAAANGESVFNNLQNQISLSESLVFGNESPSISTYIYNEADPKAVAYGFAKSGPALAYGSNSSYAKNMSKASSNAMNYGKTDAYADAYADGHGGHVYQVPIAASANLGYADADADGGTSFAGNGALGLNGAGSAAFNPAGNAGAIAGAIGGVGNDGGMGDDGNALAAALAGAGDDNDALSKAYAAQPFWQKAKAGDANGGKAKAYNDQDNFDAAQANADTRGRAYADSDANAYTEQYADSDEATAKGKNYVGQMNDIDAQSTAYNTTTADASYTTAKVYVKQNNLVKSLQVDGAQNNKGNMFLTIQSSVQQQVNNVTNNASVSAPVVQGNAVAVNTLFN